MTRKEIVRECLLDACHGNRQALVGLLDYLLIDCRIKPERLIKSAERQFGISPAITINMLITLHPTSIQ